MTTGVRSSISYLGNSFCRLLSPLPNPVRFGRFYLEKFKVSTLSSSLVDPRWIIHINILHVAEFKGKILGIFYTRRCADLTGCFQRDLIPPNPRTAVTYTTCTDIRSHVSMVVYGYIYLYLVPNMKHICIYDIRSTHLNNAYTPQ